MLETVRTLQFGDIEIREVFASGSTYVDHHHHRHAHLTIVTAGMITDTVGDHVEVLRPGDVLFHPPGISHTNTIAEPGSRGLVVEIGAAALEPFRAAWGDRPPSIRASAHVLQHVPERFIEEVQLDDAVTPMLLQSLVVEILCRAYRAAGGTRTEPRPVWLVHAVRQLEANYADPLTPAAVAREVGVSPSRLRDGLRHWYNCTFAEMLRERRVRAAVGLLETGLPLRDIARECGFYDQAHFSRAFQAVRGVSPRRFRSRLATR